MQTARLSQDYHGFIRQPAVPWKKTVAGSAEEKRSRPAVFPAERVVEGEVLRNRSPSSDDHLDRILHRGRFVHAAANSADIASSTSSARRAINAYLDNAALSNSDSGVDRSRSIDYYV